MKSLQEFAGTLPSPTSALRSLASRPIAGPAIGITALRFTGLALGFGTTFLLGMHLNADGFGQFAVFVSIAMITGLVMTMGSDQLLVREIGSRQQERLKGVARHAAGQWIAHTAIVLLLAAGLTAKAVSFSGLTAEIVTLGLVTGCTISLTYLALAALRGAGKPLMGTAPEFLGVPGCMLIAILFLLDTGSLSVDAAIIGFSGIWALAALCTASLAIRHIPMPAWSATDIDQSCRFLASSALIFAASAMALSIGRVEVLVLGASLDVAMVGLLAMALRLVGPVQSPRMILVRSSAHVFASLAHGGARDAISHRASLFATSEAAFTLLLTALTSVLAVWVAPSLGEDFSGLVGLVLLLGIGFTLRSAFGPAELILTTLRKTRVQALTSGAFSMLYAATLLFTSTAFGLIITVLSASVMLVLHGAAMWWVCWKVGGVRTDAVGVVSRARATAGS